MVPQREYGYYTLYLPFSRFFPSFFLLVFVFLLRLLLFLLFLFFFSSFFQWLRSAGLWLCSARKFLRMGNCCSDDGGGRSAVGGTSASQHDHNDAVDLFLKSRGYRGLFVQIEVRFLSVSLIQFTIQTSTPFISFSFSFSFSCFNLLYQIWCALMIVVWGFSMELKVRWKWM